MYKPLKKSFVALSTLLLLTSLPVASTSYGSTNIDRGSISAVEIKYVSVTRKFKRGTRVPSQIPYNSNGFTGYLKRASRYSYVEGDYIYWSFSGNVHKSSGGGIGPGGR